MDSQLTWATPAYSLLLLLLALKAVHVVVVIVWLLRHGSTVAKRAGRLDRKVENNERAFRDAMVAAGAGQRRGIMFFGIKDIALTDARSVAHKTSRLKWAGLTVLWSVWHGFGLALLSITALFCGAYLPLHISVVDRSLVFAVGETMVAIMFLVGVEMVVLMITLGRWLPYYHRLLPGRKINDARVRETVGLITTSIGSAIITLVIIAATLAFASRRTAASPPPISDDWALGILQSLARAIRLLGTVGDGLATDTVAGTLLTITLLPLVLTYIAFVLPIAAAVVEAGRSAPRSRATSTKSTALKPGTGIESDEPAP